MYRILSASKDTYITNKIIAGDISASFGSNVGQAGTLDLFKLYNETFVPNSSSVYELSRLLVAFDYSPLQSLTGSFLNIATGSFKVLMNLRDVYGGQTVPSNFLVSVFPLAKSWDEGRGIDVKAFRDLDSANWLTASVAGGVTTPWTVSGAFQSGNLGDLNVDYYISGNLGAGSQSLEIQQQFLRGDEDLTVDITKLVSASMVGILPNNGFRISFFSGSEVDTVTRFVKRFGSRHTRDKNLHPRLLVTYDAHLSDDQNAAFFELSNNVFVYNKAGPTYLNFVSGATSITGSNSLFLTLVASKSITVSTTSFQDNFSASITYNTTSLSYFSATFTGSQASIGGIFQTGIYTAPVLLSIQNNVSLSNYMGTDPSVSFVTYWGSLDRTVVYTTGSYVTFNRTQGTDTNVLEHNWVVNVTNLKSVYTSSEQYRFRVFIQDYNVEQVAFRLPVQTKSAIAKNMQWRLLNAFDRTVIIPFDNVATLMSYDGEGMYFDLWMQDLDVNQVYELEFQVVENNQSFLITNQGYRFKVIP